MTIDNWYVDKRKVRKDYPVIENLSQFLAPLPPKLPKEHPEYIKYWSLQAKRCIEGVWGKEFKGYRYMPGNLYFFGSFTVLEDTKNIKGVTVTKYYRPRIVDYFWEFAAQSLTAYGFVGFTKDDRYSCHPFVKLYHSNKMTKSDILEYDLPYVFRKNGRIKEYRDPFQYLLSIHKEPLGKPLFYEARDSITMGTRSGGKSYWVALAELEYNFVFGGARRYDKQFIQGGYTSTQVVGSTDTTKSSDLLAKFRFSQEAKNDADNEDFSTWFGTYKEKGVDASGDIVDVVISCPFYRKNLGTLKCPNKTNPYRAAYKVVDSGSTKEKGTKSAIIHVSYSITKGDGAQAAVGGRYLFSDVEEVGLVQNVIEVRNSNDSATKRNSFKFGVQHFQGTSGNIEYVQEAKMLFLNPDDYGIVSYENAFSEEGTNNRIGYFIPKYMIYFDCKDENGNTDYDRAIKRVNIEREKASKSSDPSVLRDLIMNEPCYVREMWITPGEYLLPYDESTERIREISKGGLYKELGIPVNLHWKSDGTVHAEVLHNAQPITSYYIKNLDKKQGVPVIYEFPIENAPDDLYIACHDPYVEEDLLRGGSLGVTYIIKRPKYLSYGITGNIIVASWIGKPEAGLDYYYQVQEKLLAFYGASRHMLWYEKNRGDYCRAYYIKRNKVHLLAPTPQFSTGSRMYRQQIRSFGFMVSNRESKLNLLKSFRDWLLEETQFPDGEIKKNIFRIPCKRLLEEIAAYNLKGNFDCVSAMLGGILALSEIAIIEERSTKSSVDLFTPILNRIYNVNS